MYVSSHTTLHLIVHKRWWWWWCVFLSKRKKESERERERKPFFISSFEVDALNGTEVSSTMMMMNIRSAFLGWCCVFSTTKWRIIKLTREKKNSYVHFFIVFRGFFFIFIFHQWLFNERFNKHNFIGRFVSDIWREKNRRRRKEKKFYRKNRLILWLTFGAVRLSIKNWDNWIVYRIQTNATFNHEINLRYI